MQALCVYIQTIIYTLFDYELNLKNDYLKHASHQKSKTLYE